LVVLIADLVDVRTLDAAGLERRRDCDVLALVGPATLHLVVRSFVAVGVDGGGVLVWGAGDLETVVSAVEGVAGGDETVEDAGAVLAVVGLRYCSANVSTMVIF